MRTADPTAGKDRGCIPGFRGALPSCCCLFLKRRLLSQLVDLGAEQRLPQHFCTAERFRLICPYQAHQKMAALDPIRSNTTQKGVDMGPKIEASSRLGGSLQKEPSSEEESYIVKGFSGVCKAPGARGVHRPRCHACDD